MYLLPRSINYSGTNTDCFLKLSNSRYSDIANIKKGYDMKVLNDLEVGHVSGSGHKHKHDKHKHHKHDKHGHGHGHGHSGCHPVPNPCAPHPNPCAPGC